ncbi:hypothetical protein HRG84_17600 [Flavisolibacter sp. BT320]|nr:hypothetical protein [Flavisolibacter longurius]
MLATSCVSVNRFSDNTYAARDKDRKAFVQTKDGVITEADEVKLRSPLIGRSTIQLDGDVKIPVKEVLAYQNGTAYYRSIRGQFAPRINKGLINMYRTIETYTDFSTTSSGRSGTRTRHQVIYWLQKGDQAETVMLTPDVTEQYVKDYAPAMEYMDLFRHNQKKVRTWSLINTASVFGGLVLAGTLGSNNTTAGNTAVIAGGGLFFGGLVNGFVNKIRKGKNYTNLQLAIDEYNYQVKRKK